MPPSFTEAQTYYVAIVKGEVAYNGKKLKKRAKITTKGELRFGSQEAYIRVSGPGGVFTFRAHEKDTRGEFVTALSQELFPTVKARNSFAYSLGIDNRRHYLFNPQTMPFWERTCSLPDTLVARAADVYFVADSPNGLLIRPAADKKGRVRINREPFKGEKPPVVSLLMVNDRAVWDRKMAEADSVVHLGGLVEYWRLNNNQQSLQTIPTDTQNGKPDVTLMTYYYPNNMVDRKPFQRELRRQVKYIQPTDTGDLLDDPAVQDLFAEIFGVRDFPNDAWNYVADLLEKQ